MNPLTPQQADEIHGIASNQGKLEAVKRYREITNCSLAEAKEAVEALTNAPPKMDAPEATPAKTMTPELEVELADMLRQGGKIPAIKRYREALPGAGLAEAKQAVEALGRKHGIPVKSDACFIATAVFEDAEAPEVRMLRRWRDTRLALTVGGRVFIRVYSVIGPVLAVVPRHSRKLRTLLRRWLSRFAHLIDR